MPTRWYNIQPDLPEPLPPPLHPGTKQPLGPADLAPLFPDGAHQAGGQPGALHRHPGGGAGGLPPVAATPLYRAYRLEKALDTPAKIYYKYEGISPPGSHKPNTAVAQAYYNKKEGIKRIATETGAGQWGSSLAFACKLFGIECKVYMVKVSYHQKPYRRIMMETWGAKCVPSPSPDTKAGRDMLAKDPDCPGSLGLAISEAVEDAVQPRRYQVLAGQRAQPRPAAPDHHRPGGHEADGDGRLSTRISSSAASAAARTSPACSCPSSRTRSAARRRTCASSASSRRAAPP